MVDQKTGADALNTVSDRLTTALHQTDNKRKTGIALNTERENKSNVGFWEKNMHIFEDERYC